MLYPCLDLLSIMEDNMRDCIKGYQDAEYMLKYTMFHGNNDVMMSMPCLIM